jgi:hypothetical protein
VLGENEPVAGSNIPVPDQVPPVGFATKVVFNEFKQNGVAWVMFTKGVATIFIVVLSVAAQIPGTVYKIVFEPLTAEDGVKSPVTVFTPTPDHEPPGRDALNVTGDEFAQSAAGKSVIVTTG